MRRYVTAESVIEVSTGLLVFAIFTLFMFRGNTAVCGFAIAVGLLTPIAIVLALWREARQDEP